MIRDGGTFDLDRQADGAVWDPMAFVGVPVAGITLAPNTLSLPLGESNDLSLRLTITPSIADNQKVSWRTGNAAVASVSDSGRVTGVSAGTVTITVETADGGFTAECVVTVTSAAVSVTGVTVSPATAEIAVGEEQALTAAVVPENATNKSVEWRSDNPNIATVSAAGVVKGVLAGTAKITAETTDGGFTAACAVTVKPAATLVYTQSVSLNESWVTLHKGRDKRLIATVLPSNATNKDLIWTCNNSYVAAVDQTGSVTAIAPGSAKITVRTVDGGFDAVCNFFVTTPATGVAISPSTTTINVGGIELLMVTVEPFNVSNANVRWSSGNEAVATVTQGGLVRGITPGEATMTATTVDGTELSGMATVIVR